MGDVADAVVAFEAAEFDTNTNRSSKRKNKKIIKKIDVRMLEILALSYLVLYAAY